MNAANVSPADQYAVKCEIPWIQYELKLLLKFSKA